jgi:FAD/FMN-containing dehydrogenase
MQRENQHASVVAPEGADHAARLFRDIGARVQNGEAVRAGILESPYRPGKGPADGETILFSHDRMNRVLEVSSGDLLAVVEGGARYGAFDRAVKEAGLYFPHEPRTDTTIAGMVMDGTILSTEGSFGGLREYILGLELVTPKGEIVRFGSRAVKDVGGYELIGFLLGQGGLCGMITKITLRLLAEPVCRAYIAGRGNLRSLKTFAYNARRGFRLALTEIFEAKAAELMVRLWEAALKDRGKPLPPALSTIGESEALLVGELQGLENVVEDQLLLLAEAGGGASLVLLDEELFGISRRFPLGALDLLGGREAFVQASYDGGAVDAPPDSLVYRSLYPERVTILAPARAAGAGEGGPLEKIKADPALAGLVSGIAGTFRRERVYMVERVGEEGFSWTRVWGQAGAERDLTNRILGVFDPQSIMLP